jgi:cytoskeleton protein RodZ
VSLKEVEPVHPGKTPGPASAGAPADGGPVDGEAANDASAAGSGQADAPTLGAALRRLREQRQRTVEQVSAVTRIRPPLIRDLEADRLASSGGTVYARGHVRAIARSLGADPEPLVALLERQAGTPTPDPGGPSTAAPAVLLPAARTGSLALPVAERPERGPRWATAATAALAVLVVLMAVGVTRPDGNDPADTGDTQAGAQTPAPVEPTPASPAPDAVAEVPTPSGAQLRVRVVGGESWISITGSQGEVFEGTVQDGWFEDFTDPEQLRLVIGNAGAVSLVCGGQDLGTAGSEGRVLRVTCGEAGLVPA